MNPPQTSQLRWAIGASLVVAALGFASGCGSKSKGAVVGSAAGAAIGGPVGQVGGAIVGIAVEEMIDEDDEPTASKDTRPIAYALETNQQVTWSNPRTGYSYQVDPIGTHNRDGKACRDFRMVTRAPAPARPQQQPQGQPQPPPQAQAPPQVAFGTGCRDSDGQWNLKG